MNLIDLINSEPLNADRSPAAVAEWCNERAAPAPVSAIDVIRVLTLADRMEDIRVAAEKGDADTNAKTMAARKMVAALRDFESFDLENPVYLNAISSRLDALVEHGLITSEMKAALLALGNNRRTRAEAAGLGHINGYDVAKVRGS